MKPRIAVHKFSSCDGCQLSLINLGEDLLALTSRVSVVQFAEAGYLAPEGEAADVDIALVEGSVSTPHELDRIRTIREHSKLLITIGACATSGGLQALRNLDDSRDEWMSAVYAHHEVIATLAHATPIAEHVKVDYELYGCPISTAQLLSALKSLLAGVVPRIEAEPVCSACKRSGYPCVITTQGKPCLGPVTRGGCNALCPSLGRDCYGCFGPMPEGNTAALAERFRADGASEEAIARRFLLVNSHAEPFRTEGLKWRENDHE